MSFKDVNDVHIDGAVFINFTSSFNGQQMIIFTINPFTTLSVVF